MDPVMRITASDPLQRFSRMPQMLRLLTAR